MAINHVAKNVLCVSHAQQFMNGIRPGEFLFVRCVVPVETIFPFFSSFSIFSFVEYAERIGGVQRAIVIL